MRPIELNTLNGHIIFRIKNHISQEADFGPIHLRLINRLLLCVFEQDLRMFFPDNTFKEDWLFDSLTICNCRI